ncbi:MAG: pyrroloquinoline quinone biosynthesis protein PqqB [Burkholderiales bacterium]|nr:pyrroloquinoline quinone biosynthesis protein PqqB [Burkholderiales bacterium]
MKILVLGSGAGGGFPQWNCQCRQCAAFRSGRFAAPSRTQSSVAVSADGERWVLINASPDISQQIRDNPALHPRGGPRDTPIKAVVLTDSQLENVAGLLSLRESAGLEVYTTPIVFEDLTADLPLLGVLESYCAVRWHMLPVAGAARGAEFEIAGFDDLAFCAVAVPGATPPHARHRGDIVGGSIAIQIEDRRNGQRFFYSPALAAVGENELEWLRGADCVMVDGTFWHEDELAEAGLSPLTASQLGHLPQRGHDGRAGMLDVLSKVAAPRKILTAVNNSNPILDEQGSQRRALAAHGIEVAHDGMVIEL